MTKKGLRQTQCYIMANRGPQATFKVNFNHTDKKPAPEGETTPFLGWGLRSSISAMGGCTFSC